MKTKVLVFVLIVSISSATGFFVNQFFSKNDSELITPFVSLQKSVSFPLLTYSINNLKQENTPLVN